MSWALDVGWAHGDGTGTSTTVAFQYGSAVAAGAALLCFVGGEPASVATITVADDMNGAWTQFGQGSPVTTGSQDWIWGAFYRLNSAAGQPVVTATFGSSAASRSIAIGSYTGIATASAFNVGAGQGQSDPGTGANAVSTGATGATAEANELAIAGMRTQLSVAASTGTGWTQRYSNSSGVNMTFHVQDKNVASPAAVTGTWTINNAAGDTMSIVGTFKEASSGTVVPVFMNQYRQRRA